MLKVFVSTQETQGQRENDFNFVPEGELVMYPMSTCTNEKADGNCGCARSMCGAVTRTATTTMKVVEHHGDVGILADLIEAAAPFKVGAIVEYRDGQFSERT